MATNDFYLSFGSNAKQFGETLQSDLGGAEKALAKIRAEVAGVAKELVSLAGALKRADAAADNLGAKVKGIKPGEGGGGGGGSGGGGSGGGGDGGGTVTVKVDIDDLGLKDFAKRMAKVTGSIDKAIREIAKNNATIGTAFGGLTPAAKGEVTRRNRSAAQRAREDIQGRYPKGARDEDTGEKVGGQFIREIRRIVLKSGERVTMGQVTDAQLGQATVDRLTKAVEKNTEALKKLRGRLDDGVEVSGTSGDTGSAKGAQVKAKKDEAAEIELEAAEEAVTDARTTRKEQKEARRKAAKEEREAAQEAQAEKGDPGLSQQERSNRRRDIELAAASLEDLVKQPKDALRRVLGTLEKEGYGADFASTASKFQGKAVTKETLSQAIVDGFNRLAESGGQTLHDLTPSKRAPAAENFTSELKRTLDELVEATRERPGQAQAREFRSADLATGGRGEPISGHRDVGTAFGELEIRKILPIVDRLLKQRHEQEIPEANLESAARVLSKGTPIYDPRLDEAARGKSEGAQEYRRALAGTRRAVDAIDAVVEKFGTLQTQAEEAAKSLDRMEKEATQLERSATQTPEQGQRIAHLRTELIPQAAKRHDDLSAKADAMIEGDNLFIKALWESTKYRKGLATRNIQREERQGGRQGTYGHAERIQEMRDRARDRWESQQAPELALAQALGARRTRIGARSGQNVGQYEQSVAAFPGLRVQAQGKPGDIGKFLSDEVDPELLKKLNKTRKSLVDIMRKIHEAESAGLVDLEEVNLLREKEAEVQKRLFRQYDDLGLQLKTGEARRVVRREITERGEDGKVQGTGRFELMFLSDDVMKTLSNRVTDANKILVKAAEEGFQLTEKEFAERWRSGGFKGKPPTVSELQSEQDRFNEVVGDLGQTPVMKWAEDVRTLTKDERELSEVRAKALKEERIALEALKKAERGPRKAKREEGEGLLEGQSPDPKSVATFEQAEQALRGVGDEAEQAAAALRAARESQEAAQTEAQATEVAAARAVYEEKKRAREAAEGVEIQAAQEQVASTRRTSSKKKEAAKAEEQAAEQSKKDTQRQAGLTKSVKSDTKRLQALLMERERVQDGGEFDPKLFRQAAGRSKSFKKLGEETGYEGDKYLARIDKAAISLHDKIMDAQAELAGFAEAVQDTTAKVQAADGSDAHLESVAQQARAATPGADPVVASADASAKAHKTVADAASMRAMAMQTLSSLSDKLSEETLEEVAALQALVGAGADAGQIFEQLIPIFAGLKKELGDTHGFNADAVKNALQQISAAAGAPISASAAHEVSKTASARGFVGGGSGGPPKDPFGGSGYWEGEGDSAREAFARTLFGNRGFWGRIANSTGTFIVRNFTAGLVFGLTAALRDVISQAIETESTFVRVSHALEATGRASGNLRTQLQEISTQYGVALIDVYETSAQLVGLFDEVDDIAGATKVVAQLQMIAGGAFTASEAVGALASVTSAFSEELAGQDGLQHVADVLTVIQNRLGVNVEVTAEGIGRLSGLAHQIGLTFEQTGVFVAEIAKKTNQTGAAAGEQFSRIIAAMQTGRGQRVLAEALPGTGIQEAMNVGDFGGAWTILLENYEKLDKAQQSVIATTLGGQRQAAALAALLRDGAGALDTVTAATNSYGEADERAAKITETLNRQIEILQTNFVNIGAALVRAGILDVFAKILVVTNAVVGSVNDLLSRFNDLTESNPLINFLAKATAALIALNLALKVAKSGIAGLSAFMRAGPGRQAVMNTMGAPLLGGMQAGTPGGSTAADLARRQMAERLAERDYHGRLGVRGQAARVTRNFFSGTSPDRAMGPTGKLNELVAAKPWDAASKGMDSLSLRLRSMSAELMRVSQAARAESVALAQEAQAKRASAQTTAQLTAARNLETQATQRAQVAAAAHARALTLRATAQRAEAGGARLGAVGDRARGILRGGAGYTGNAGAGLAGIGRTMRGVSEGLDQRALSATIQGNRGLSASYRTMAGGALLASSAANGMSKAVSGTAKALGSTTVRAAGANAAMLTFMIGMGLVIQEMSRASQFAKDFENAWKSSFTEEGREDPNSEKAAERFIGKNTELWEKNLESAMGKDSAWNGYTRAVGSVLSGYMGVWADRVREGDKTALIPPVFNTSIRNEILDRGVGVGAEVDEWEVKIGEQFEEAWSRLTDLAGSAMTSSEDVLAVTRDATKQMEETAAEILATDMSKEQKTTLGASLERNRMGIERQAKDTLAKARGLQDLDRLMNSQISELSELLGFMASTPGAGNYPQALAALYDQLGASDPGSSVYEDFKVLADFEAGTADLLRSQLSLTEQLLDEAVLNYESKRASGDEPEEIAKAEGFMKSFMSQAEATKRAIIEAEVNSLNELSQVRIFSGDTAGAAEAQRAAADFLRQQVEESRANRQYNWENPLLERRPTLSRDDEQALLNRSRQTDSQATQQAVEAKNKHLRSMLTGVRAATAIAEIQSEMAQNALELIMEMYLLGKASEEDLLRAQEAAASAGAQVRDSRASDVQAKYSAQAAGILNSVSKARTEEAGAWAAVTHARNEYGAGSAEYLNALASARSASQATKQAVLDEAAALRETALARMSPSDTLGRARAALANAKAAQAEARRFGTSSTQYQQATQQVISAQREVENAIREIADANANLSIAIANAAGKTVDAARIRLEQAKIALKRAKKDSGKGVDSAAVKNAEAEIVQAEADLRDARLQEALDTIDFQRDMEEITAKGAIAMLKNLLTMKDLTEQQRRDILRRIKALEDELSATLSGVFNLPEQIKVPTVYEVRRLLGIDKAVAEAKELIGHAMAPGSSSAAPSGADNIAQQISSALAGVSAPGPRSVDNSTSSSVVNVNGASLDQVMALIQKQLGQNAQVVRTASPRRF